MMVIHDIHVLELRIRMNVDDHNSLLALLQQQREKPENVVLEREFEP